MNTRSSTSSAAVIGAGLGGLSAAIALASEGYHVTVIEKNDKVGGKLNIIEKNGFTFDLGPSILTMPHIFGQLFALAGKKLEDYVDIQPVTPHWRNFFSDGTVFDLTPDEQQQAEELSKLGGKAPEEFRRFMDYAQKLGQATENGYFSEGLDTLGQLLKHYGLIGSLKQFDIFRSMDQGVRRYVSDPKLVQALDYFIKYVGSSPYDAPALMNLLPYIQYAYGLWYVGGGMYGLARAMQTLAEELGVVFHVNAEVEKIKHDQHRAFAVQVKDLGDIAADIIVSNMEVIPAGERLLQRSERQMSHLKRFSPTCSGLVIHLGIDRQYEQLAHHNFFYSDKPEKHFRSVFHDNVLSEDPTIYLVAPVKTDPGQAPASCEVIKALPHIPHIHADAPKTEQDYLDFRQRVLDKLEKMGLTGLQQHIVCEETWTPLDIQSRYYSNQGSIYGVVADRFKNLGFKAPQRDKFLTNLYYVGGSVNPGGGMPMVTLSGMLVKDKILRDRRTA